MPLFSVWVMVEYGPGSGRQWLPVLGWIRDLVRKQHNKDGKNSRESKTIGSMEHQGPHGLGGHEPPSSGLPHKKAT